MTTADARRVINVVLDAPGKDEGIKGVPQPSSPPLSQSEVTDLCAECGTEITQHERDTDDVRIHDDGREYHWACLQERYERDRLAREQEES
jgi:hypothetical protein